MDNDELVSRTVCRQKSEDLWRSFLTFAAQGSQELGRLCILRFEERVQAEAATMPEAKAIAYIKMIEEERESLMDEYLRSPEILKTRLGVSRPSVFSQRRPPSAFGAGQTVATTAVRATVWESIRAAFRMFR